MIQILTIIAIIVSQIKQKIKTKFTILSCVFFIKFLSLNINSADSLKREKKDSDSMGKDASKSAAWRYSEQYITFTVVSLHLFIISVKITV